MGNHRLAFIFCSLVLTACTISSRPSTLKNASTTTPFPITLEPTPTPTRIPTKVVADEFLQYPSFGTDSSVTFLPKQPRVYNGIRMFLERFDVAYQYVNAILCFDIPFSNKSGEWVIGKSAEMEIGRDHALLNNTLLLMDTNKGYIIGDFVPPWDYGDRDMRCINANFQFGSSARQITELVQGFDTTLNFKLLIPNLQILGFDDNLEGPWIFSGAINP
jgi:hypothetical protein